MPLYEFECQSCTRHFEKLVRSAAAAREVTCLQCGSTDVKKIISAGSHRLPGSPAPAAPACGAGCPSGSRFR